MEGGRGLGKYRQGMTTNLLSYQCYNKFILGYTTDMHIDSGWLKTNGNFGGFFKALGRENQGGITGMGGIDVPPAAAAITESSSNSV